MGMLDQVLGNLFGSQQSGTPGASNSMSPVVRGVLLLLATKAIQSYTASNRPGTQAPSASSSDDPAGASEGGLGGSLGGLGGGLGGLLAGLGGAGAVGSLVDQFKQKGFGEQVNSWIGTGQNEPIAPNQVADALGPDAIDQLSRQFQVPRDQCCPSFPKIFRMRSTMRRPTVAFLIMPSCRGIGSRPV
jgi:uncharacterized protein YidB (DUF937 family)